MTKSQILLYEIIKRSHTVDDKTKLAKLEYLADFIHYAFNNSTISQEENIYTRQKQGPLSRSLSADLQALIDNDYVEENPRFNYKLKNIFETNLSASESRTIDYTLEKYGRSSWRELVDITHNQAPYLSTKESGIVELFTAYNLIDEYPDYAPVD
jgi:uncharacterized phage-associated protein